MDFQFLTFNLFRLNTCTCTLLLLFTYFKIYILIFSKEISLKGESKKTTKSYSKQMKVSVFFSDNFYHITRNQ